MNGYHWLLGFRLFGHCDQGNKNDSGAVTKDTERSKRQWMMGALKRMYAHPNANKSSPHVAETMSDKMLNKNVHVVSEDSKAAKHKQKKTLTLPYVPQ